jgi:hypothetical protein
MFLAFPAILPATLTLIDETDGKRQAEGNAAGAVIGSAALGAFGVTGWLLLGRIPSVLAALAAFAAWLAFAVGAYLLLARVVNRPR